MLIVNYRRKIRNQSDYATALGVQKKKRVQKSKAFLISTDNLVILNNLSICFRPFQIRQV